jgi:hypothetical protein
MNSHIIPVVKPLKKSFIIVALIFLLIGFGIEFGGPLPSPNPKDLVKSIKEAEDNFSKDDYWDEINDDVSRAINTAIKNSPCFDIKVVDNEEKDAFKHCIEFPAEDEEMLEEAKDRITKWKLEKIKERIKTETKKPPGYALKADGLFIWTVFFSFLVSLIGMLISKAFIQRIGMIASLINAIIVIFMSIFLIVKAIIKLIIIFVLLASFFLAFLYWIIYEIPFPTGRVLSLAGLGLFCKIVAAILIWLGGSHIIRIKTSTLLIITGFVTSIIIMIVLPIGRAITFAYIADAIIGIIIAIVVIVWSVYVLIGSIRGLISTTIT